MDDEEFLQWLKENLPKEYFSVLNNDKMRVAENAIHNIYNVFMNASADFDDEDKPRFSAKFDPLFGTDLCFSVMISEIGIKLIKNQIDMVYSVLPENVIFSIQPLNNGCAEIEFTFRDVKELIAAE